MNKNNWSNLILFIHTSEALKNEYRSTHTSKGQPDSVASHSWRVALLVFALSEHLKSDFNLTKALKMAIIHDLGEVFSSDYPIESLISDHNLMKKKHLKEKSGFEHFEKLLGPILGKEIKQLWFEFEENITLEARVVNAADKLEALLQNIEGNQRDPFLKLKGTKIFDDLNRSFIFDESIYSFKEQILQEYYEKTCKYRSFK